jgi:Fur family ferric uptake transcriptional regulator
MPSEGNIKEAKELFAEYLEEKKHRKTPERFAILEEIYSRDDHFDVEKLYLELKQKNYHISRATVYNTLNLLLDCKLVVKQQFGDNVALYEKSYGYRQHDHLICNNCNEVLEFCDPRIQQIQNMMGDLLHFNIQNHSLTLYGEPRIDENGKCLTCLKNLA